MPGGMRDISAIKELSWTGIPRDGSGGNGFNLDHRDSFVEILAMVSLRGWLACGEEARVNIRFMECVRLISTVSVCLVKVYDDFDFYRIWITIYLLSFKDNDLFRF